MLIAAVNQLPFSDSEYALDAVTERDETGPMSDHETDRNWHWQAIDSERNIARDYRLSVFRDLFGWLVVEQRWGRIGTMGQAKVLAFADQTDALRHIAAVKARRASAEKRLGVGYREVTQSR